LIDRIVKPRRPGDSLDHLDSASGTRTLVQGMKSTIQWLSISTLCLSQLACVSNSPNEPVTPPGGTTNQLAIVNTQLGLGYLRNGQLDLAFERLNTATEADPGYAMAHNGLALVYDRLNRPEKAEEQFKIAIDLNPSDSAAMTNYGAFLCQHNRIDEGEEYFKKAVANPLYTKPAMAYSNAGICKLRADDRAGAEVYFRAALKADPRFPIALLNMAQISFDDQAFLAARAYMQRYEEVSNHSPRSLWLGIQIEEMLGDKNAVSSFAMLLKSNYPDSPETQKLFDSGLK